MNAMILFILKVLKKYQKFLTKTKIQFY